MKNLFLVGILCLSYFIAYTQIEEVPPPPPEVEVMEEVLEEEEPEFMDMEIEADYPVQMPDVVVERVISYNPNYAFEKVTEEIQFFYDKFDQAYPRKYGLMKNGEVVMPRIFTKSGYNYYNPKETAILGIANRFGIFNFINMTWDIPLMYESIAHFGNNIYSVKKDGLQGMVDGQNRALVAFEWSYIEAISGLNNYIVVTDNSYPVKLKGVYNISKKNLSVPCQYTQLSLINGDTEFKVVDGVRHNIIDIENNPRFETWYENIIIPTGGRKLFIVKNEGKMGVIDEDENQVVPIEYLEIRNYPFNDGSYMAKNKDGKYGCIMLDGRVTLPFEYNNVNTQYGNSLIAYKEDKCGIVQVNNGLPYEITTCEYDGILGLNQIFIVEKNGKYGIMDKYGKMVSDLDYDKIENLSTNYYDQVKLLMAYKNKKAYLMDNSGKLVTEDGYNSIDRLVISNPTNNYSYNNKYNYLIYENKKGKKGILDKLGAVVIEAQFDDILLETNNMITVKKDGKTGLFHIMEKKMILPYEYDQLLAHDQGFIGVNGNEFYLITNRGSVKVQKY